MKRKSLFQIINLTLLFITICSSATAQFFESGDTPFNINWNRLKSDNKQLVFPDYFLQKAKIIEGYMDTLTPVITTALNPKIDKIPVVIMPQKSTANGLVSWAPKRMELYTTPPTDNYAFSWLKQLVSHEYRHVVQMSNLNTSIVKGGSYIVGEAAVGLATLLVSGWFYEGDAVLAETQLSEFGRGKQPDFSIGYRAMLNELPKNRWNYERLRCGTMKLEYPTKYNLGYYIVWAGQTHYDRDIWAQSIDFSTRRAYYIDPFSIFFKKYYNVDKRKIALDGFNELKELWSEASAEPNSSEFVKNDYKWYRENKYMLMYDTSTVISAYSSADDALSLKFTNIESGEENIAQTSFYLSSRMAKKGDYLYWTEFTPSKFWVQKNYSEIKSVKIEKVISKKSGKTRYKFSERKNYHNREYNCFFVTPISNNRFAYIGYNQLSNPSLVVVNQNFEILTETPIGGWDSSVNGLAWDDLTQKLYLIVIDNDGLSLKSFDVRSLEFATIKKPSLVTQKDLSAADGKLYFSSIASGKDEAHCFDLSTGKEYKLTSSKYGSFSPTTPFLNSKGELSSVVSTYKLMGYHLATQKIEKDSTNEVEIERKPIDRLNPKWLEWNVMKLDTINIDPSTPNPTKVEFSKRRPFALNPHTWVPLAVNIPQLMSEYDIMKIKVGATVMSQDVLGELTTTAGYGYVLSNKMSMGFATIDYKGLPVEFSVDLTYGGVKQNIYEPYSEVVKSNKSLKNHFDITTTASLPINLSDGRALRYLQPFVSYNFANNQIATAVAVDGNHHQYNLEYSKGMDKMSVGLAWQSNKYGSTLDLESPFSYYINGSSSFSVMDRERFGKLYSLYGEMTFPGIFANNSVVLKGAAQYQDASMFNFLQKSLYPTGCDFFYASEKLFAASAEYKFPIAYPNGGIPNLIYFKRIAGGAVGEYAHNKLASTNDYTLNPYSYGGKLILDFCLLTIPTIYTVDLGIFKPSDKKGVVFDFGFNIVF